MAPRLLHILGTASQAPTRHRNQNGYLVRWQLHGTPPDVTLFEAGEGTEQKPFFAFHEGSASRGRTQGPADRNANSP